MNYLEYSLDGLGKHGKPGKLMEIEKLSKSQGKLREFFIFVEKPGKLRENIKYVT